MQGLISAAQVYGNTQAHLSCTGSGIEEHGATVFRLEVCQHDLDIDYNVSLLP